MERIVEHVGSKLAAGQRLNVEEGGDLLGRAVGLSGRALPDN